MFGNLGRRLTRLTVLFFAFLGFAFVPLGNQTGLGHVRAIFGTAAVGEAARELVVAAGRLKTQLARAFLSDSQPAETEPGSVVQMRVAPLTPAPESDAGVADSSL